MRVVVLGSAAGGGFPQWNCNCPNCRGFRGRTVRAVQRTQSSIAVTTDTINWVLINASPDIAAQLNKEPRLQPGRKIRDSGIKAIILVDSQIDHTAGLLMLREGDPLAVYCTESVGKDLYTGNPIFKILQSYCGLRWHSVPIGRDDSFRITGVEGLRFWAFPVAGKAPPFSPHRETPAIDDNIGLIVEDEQERRTLFYAPGLAAVDQRMLAQMERADCLLVDGTFWSEDEMIVRGTGRKRASEMGHLPQSGSHGMLSILERLARPRKILIHVNNTNPILDENSAERRELERAGVEVAYDGMEIVPGG